MNPLCPLCETPAVEDPGTDDASDGVLVTTHRCANPKCGKRFKFTPPSAPFNRPRVRIPT